MHRYLLCVILLSNLASGMEESESSNLSPQLAEKIRGIRQSAKESLQGWYPNLDLNNPKNAEEKAAAETILQQLKSEENIPYMSPKELNQLWPKVSGWYWSDSWRQKIKERLDDLRIKRLQ